MKYDNKPWYLFSKLVAGMGLQIDISGVLISYQDRIQIVVIMTWNRQVVTFSKSHVSNLTLKLPTKPPTCEGIGVLYPKFRLDFQDIGHSWWLACFRRCYGTVASFQALSSKRLGGGGESLVTSIGKFVDFQHLALVVLIRMQNETMCTRDICPLNKTLQLKNEFISTDYTSKVGENCFWMCRRDTSPKSLRLKFTVVGLWDRLAEHTSQLWVYVYKVHHRT